MKLTFGKYKGEEIKDIPVSYLSWLLTSNFINSITRNAITESLAGRKKKSKKPRLYEKKEPVTFNTGEYFGEEPKNVPRKYLQERYDAWRETLWEGSLYSELMEEIQKILYIDVPWPKPPWEVSQEKTPLSQVSPPDPDEFYLPTPPWLALDEK
jgi:hypothetical protein